MRDAYALHRRTPVADLHVDTLIPVRHVGYDVSRRHRNRLPGSPFFWQADVPRWREAGFDLLLLGVVSFPVLHLERGCAAAADAMIDHAERIEASLGGALRLCGSVEDIGSVHDTGAIAAVLTMEGAHMLEGDLDNLRHFHARGVRSIGLTHFSRNSACVPAFGRGRNNSAGLTSFGTELIREMNRLGIVVDLAHTNRKTFLETCSLSTRPCIVSHTGLRALRDMWRNIDDDQLRRIADTGGCVGVIFAGAFLQEGGRCTSERVATALEHVIDTVGYDHAAYGTDFDGAIVPPVDVPDVSAVPRVTARLLQRGHSTHDLEKILGGNILRVLGETCSRGLA